MASQDIHVPELGDFKNIPVIDLLVKVGDTVQVDTPLLTLETEKATMDVPSPLAGVIEKLHVDKSSRVSAGTLIATVRTEGGAAAAGAPANAAGKPAADSAAAAATGGASPAAGAGSTARAPGTAGQGSAATAATGAQAAAAGASGGAAGGAAQGATSAAAQAARSGGASGAGTPAAGAGPATGGIPAVVPGGLPPVNEAGFSKAHASPSVRQFARELGVDLSRVTGSGQKGRVTQEDVKAFVKAAMSSGVAAGGAGAGLPKIPVPDFAQFGPVEVKPLSRVQRISGPRLHASWVNLPHVTQFDEADITELEEARGRLKGQAAERGLKLTPLAFIVRACVRALQRFPLFNASLDASGENLVLKKYIHVGFAADTPNGLLVPVIRDADRKDIYEIARALAELSDKARNGKLAGSEMQGGSFTISSLGGIGGTAFTPIINAPEVAILGVSRSAMKPVWRETAFVPRLMLPLSLSYDHRVIDGANGARFTDFLARALADVSGLLEAVP